MMRLLSSVFCLGFAGAAYAVDIPTHINHQGVIAVHGERFTGEGDFWFALVNSASGVNLWTNDGSHLGEADQRPNTSELLTVINGVYNVRLGADGMTSIIPSIFTVPDVALRIWFDDGVNGAHQIVASLVRTLVRASG